MGPGQGNPEPGVGANRGHMSSEKLNSTPGKGTLLEGGASTRNVMGPIHGYGKVPQATLGRKADGGTGVYAGVNV